MNHNQQVYPVQGQPMQPMGAQVVYVQSAPSAAPKKESTSDQLNAGDLVIAS